MASRFLSRMAVARGVLWQTLATLGRRHPNPSPRRILVAHHLLLGDTLMLTPLLAKLRALYPHAKVIMATPKAVAPLYQSRPFGVIAIPYDPRDPSSLAALRRPGGYDLAIVPGDNRYSWVARAMGARWIVAFSGDRPAYKSWPVDQQIPYPSQAAAWGDMVAGLVAGSPPEPYRPAEWPDPVHTPFPSPRDPYCVLHVGASSPLKLWAPQEWRALAAWLTKKGYQVVWSGGRGEGSIVAAIDPESRYLSFAGRLDLPQLWHLAKGARLLVCPDTGVAHLGRLTGTPTVALFGPGSAAISGGGRYWQDSPYRAVTIPEFPCRDQHLLFKRELAWVHRCSRSPAECPSPACMQAIGVKAVQNAVDELLISVN
jgi:ADP-heptose:LPS heptosyltransferase